MTAMEGGNLMKVVIFVGPPGSGKDTQADMLVREYGMTQVPSSQIIYKKFEEDRDDPVVQEQIRRVKEGYLNDPTLTGRWIMEYVRDQLPSGKSLVFSGSPRTVPEAKEEITKLDELVGLQNVVVIDLYSTEQESRDRISHRRYCKANKHSVPWTSKYRDLTTCPWDGSELYVRDLDKPELQDKRFQEFRELTVPTVEYLKSCGIPFFVVDGNQEIEAIHAEVAAIVERRLAPAPIE